MAPGCREQSSEVLATLPGEEHHLWKLSPNSQLGCPPPQISVPPMPAPRPPTLPAGTRPDRGRRHSMRSPPSSPAFIAAAWASRPIRRRTAPVTSHGAGRLKSALPAPPPEAPPLSQRPSECACVLSCEKRGKRCEGPGPADMEQKRRHLGGESGRRGGTGSAEPGEEAAAREVVGWRVSVKDEETEKKLRGEPTLGGGEVEWEKERRARW